MLKVACLETWQRGNVTYLREDVDEQFPNHFRLDYVNPHGCNVRLLHGPEPQGDWHRVSHNCPHSICMMHNAWCTPHADRHNLMHVCFMRKTFELASAAGNTSRTRHMIDCIMQHAGKRRCSPRHDPKGVQLQQRHWSPSRPYVMRYGRQCSRETTGTQLQTQKTMLTPKYARGKGPPRVPPSTLHDASFVYHVAGGTLAAS